LARSADDVAKDTGTSIIIVPQFTDIKQVSEEVDIPVFSQHLDPVKPGAYTGHIVADAIKSAGATGTLLNHSERRIGIKQIDETLRITEDADLITLVCADTPTLSREIAQLKPDSVAIEPPDLIGTGIAVSNSRPELITDAVREVGNVNSKVPVLCGAGISTGVDVRRAVELGAKGVLVASSIVKAKNPENMIREMANALLE
jgi:triosephosphate isomerase